MQTTHSTQVNSSSTINLAANCQHSRLRAALMAPQQHSTVRLRPAAYTGPVILDETYSESNVKFYTWTAATSAAIFATHLLIQIFTF